MFQKIIIVFLGCYGLSGFGFYALPKHSDKEMMDLMDRSHQAAINSRGDAIFGIRCPYDDKPDEYKYALIEKGFKDGLYSNIIRQHARDERLYPMMPTDLNGDPFVQYWCEFGCFSLSTNIWTIGANGEFKHKKAQKITFRTELAAVSSEHFFDEPVMIARSIKKIIKGQEGEAERLISFHLSNGNILNVTANHGMVLADGRVVPSQNVSLKDCFVGYNGESVQITEISDYDQNEGVINFRLAGDKTGSDHIMGAEGVLVGDHAWQSDMRDDLNGIALRRKALN